MYKTDLHLHTTHSDGNLSPSELIDLCYENGLRHISITDHDSTEGIEESINYSNKYPDLEIIPGIELSTDFEGAEIHMLGFYINYKDKDLQKVLKDFRDGRQNRAYSIVEKLKTFGVDISWERVLEISNKGSVGRPHIAQAMVEKGYVKYPKEAFEKYLGRDQIGYISRTKFTPEQSIELITKYDGIPVIAHPTYIVQKSAHPNKDLEKILSKLKIAGLKGIEVYYNDYTKDQIISLLKISQKLDLIPCGGSDYHASGNPNEIIPGTVGPPVECLIELKKIRHPF
ncbi:MAG: PHP domain-containing protein [Dehalococcoidia bacterium]